MELQEHSDRTTLIVRGPVRLGEVAGLLEHARAAAARKLDVDLDLGPAEHLHAAAWQVLIALAKQVRADGARFQVRVSDSAAAMLEFLDLEAWASATEEGVEE